MKQHTSWLATAVALAGGMAVVGSAHAQAVTGDANLDNISPTALYGSWGSGSVTDGPNGIEVTVAPAAYGSGYWAVPTPLLQTLYTSDNQATLVMTVNGAVSPPGNPGSGYWLGIPFILNDNTGAVTYGGYNGEFGGSATWNGSTVTETVPLSAGQIAAIQAGGDTIYGFNLELDPAVYPTFGEDVTFNSLTLSSSVPEPSSLALLGSGAAALWSFRRRNK